MKIKLAHGFANVITDFLKNKKSVKRTSIIVAVSVLASIVASTTHNNHMEKITLEQIEEHIESEEYEFVFDKINSGYISDEDMEKYRKVVVPYMQDVFTNAKESEQESLTLIVARKKYFIYDGRHADEIYTKQGDDRVVLYETPDDVMEYVAGSYISWDYHLDSDLSMYANNAIFFMERCYCSELSSSGLDGDVLYEELKCFDLDTGVVKKIGRDKYFWGLYKLEDGSIFAQYSYYDMQNGGQPNPCGGIRYNPYTKTTYEGDNVVTKEEIENAIYKCS